MSTFACNRLANFVVFIFQERMPVADFIHGRCVYKGKDDRIASGSYALHTRTWRSTCSA